MSPEDRRRAIVAATVPLIVEHGDRVTTRLIAEAAGVAEGTIFRVFPDKDALLLAAAEETLNPTDGREALLASVAGIEDLHELVRRVAEHMFVRSERVGIVLMALRRVWARGHQDSAHHAEQHTGHHGTGSGHAPADPGPPAFVVEAHRALLERLTAVLEPFADQLTVSPERAALLLRTLVLGSRHPGMQAEDRLSADEVATVLLDGVGRRERR
jgi:AcrR family transcriptional regulator